MRFLATIMGKEEEMPNRTLCDTLQEMRDLLAHFVIIFQPPETEEISDANILIRQSHTALHHHILGLIEEAQSHGNRMESALYDQHEILQGAKTRKKLKAVRRKLLNEIIDLELDIEALREEKKKKLAKGLTKKKKTGTIKSKKKGGK